MTKLAQEHSRAMALTDSQLLSIGVSSKGQQAYARLLVETIDALANPQRQVEQDEFERQRRAELLEEAQIEGNK